MIKIPPPILVIILIISVYFSSKKTELIHLPYRYLISTILLSIGLLVLLNPVINFIKSKTTVNPINLKM